jgi:type II secretory pathway pseudopilin PulG
MVMHDEARTSDRGFIMVALLVSMAAAAVWLTVLVPTWRQQSIRQKEDDLVFRGEQIARAIVFYQNKNQGANPPNIDLLVSQKYLRKKYKDPFTGKDFDIVMGGQVVSGSGQPQVPQPGTQQQPQQGRGGQQATGITGVRSPSPATSIRIYQNQQTHNMWPFDAQVVRQLYRMPFPQNPNQPGGGPGRQQPGAQPGAPGRGGQPVIPGGPGRGPGAGDRPGGAPGRGGAPAGPVGRGRGLN